MKNKSNTISSEDIHKEDLKVIGKPIGQRLKKSREDKKLSEEGLSKASSVSKEDISLFENGLKMMSLGQAKSMCKALDITVEYLVTGKI